MEIKNQKSEILAEYVENCTIHGLAKVQKSRQWASRLFWGFIFFCCIILGGVNFLSVLFEYFEYKTYLLVQSHQEEAMKFPSITICNANNLQRSKLNQYMDTKEYYRQLLNETLDKGAKLSLLQSKIWLGLHGNRNMKMAKETHSGSESLFLDGMQDWCVFGSFQNCSKEDFTDYFYNSFLGFCKTFNANGKYKQMTVGATSGLRLTLYLNQNDYMTLPPNDMGAGLLVLVHPQDVYPYPFSDQIFIQPGTITHIGLEKKVFYRQAQPYHSKCVHREGNSIYPGRYTLENCRESDYLLMAYNKCNLLESAASYHLQRRGKNVSLQARPNVDTTKCIMRLYDDKSNQKIHFDCPESCYQETFAHTSSSTRWPTQVDLSYYRKVYAKILNMTDVSEQFVYNNFVQLRISLKSLSYQKITETPVISITSLLCDFGGSMGLFLGASVFSLLEFFAFIFSVVSSHFKASGKTVSSKEQDNDCQSK